MIDFLTVGLFVALGLTFLVLALGVFSMFRGGAINNKYANKLMRLRITMQAIAIAIFALILIMGQGK